ncbi:hypothetical protein [Actinoallomurus rhizosphaericola]|uniref:hypothetical protein n=1 Tax=Actinoallomurus rhizosphaericola TaxID=2952536 RepID=UPI002092715F|nr:hypothetical protein [Actinoallomurus rhizosphaericola]MCO5998928.1 hypothetical protein [Actinoallomurus rhizosphaericola]
MSCAPAARSRFWWNATAFDVPWIRAQHERIAHHLPGIYDPTDPGKLLFAFFAAMAETEPGPNVAGGVRATGAFSARPADLERITDEGSGCGTRHAVPHAGRHR